MIKKNYRIIKEEWFYIGNWANPQAVWTGEAWGETRKNRFVSPGHSCPHSPFRFSKGPFTRAIFFAQFDAIFVAPKLHEVARPVYTGDFCRATQCNFCRAEIASSFEHVRNLMQLRRDKNCIELRDKNRLCKRALKGLWGQE